MNSYIRKAVMALDAYAPGEQPADGSILKLNTNENPYPPCPGVESLLASYDPAELRRYPDPECNELRGELAALHGCEVDQVFVGNGSDEILALCMRAFVEREGSIGFFDPSYSLYPVLAAIEDIETRPVILPDDFAWTMPESYDASLFLITNPNAPTSMLFPKREVAAFCGASAGVVVIDEAYVDFSSENCLDLVASRDNVIVTRTLSKSCSLAGIRLGYAVGPEPLIGALHKIKDSYNVSRLSQQIAVAALRDRAYFEATIRKVRSTRERVSRELREIGFEVAPSEANFLWIRPPAGSAEALFCRLRKARVLVRFFPGLRTERHLRVSVGTDEEMDRFLDVVGPMVVNCG